MSELKKPIVFPEVDCSGEPKGFTGESWPTLYQDLQEARQQMWTERAVAYEANQDDFYAAWMWLHHHPIFWYFGSAHRHERALCADRGVDEGLEFRPAMVDPETRRVEDEPERNTHLEIWVEVFPSSMGDDGRDGRLHDYVCDTGGDTYEAAVIDVAKEIYERHGHDRTVLHKEWSGA